MLAVNDIKKKLTEKLYTNKFIVFKKRNRKLISVYYEVLLCSVQYM